MNSLFSTVVDKGPKPPIITSLENAFMIFTEDWPTEVKLSPLSRYLFRNN